METPTEIYFYSHIGRFGYMSNFYSCNFVDSNGVRFNCTEQYLMYHKAKLFDPSLMQDILKETSPTKIKQFGRMIKGYDDTVWSDVRYTVMVNGLRLKFSQNKDIYNRLVSTRPKILYEASPYDRIWGIGYRAAQDIQRYKSDFGTNLLGRALMEIRN